MLLTVLSHSQLPLTTPLDNAGQQAIALVEQHSPQRLVALVEGAINDGTNTACSFATWADLARAAKRLMTVSMFNAVLPAERQELARWREGALKESAAYGDAQREISKLWANCAATTMNVIARLRSNYGATISKVAAQEYRANNLAGLNGALTQLPPGAGEIYILDCDLQGIHNFLIEVHSNGDRYLVQGYQCHDAYSAPWWVSDTLYEPTNVASNTADVVNHRAQYGNGANIVAHYANLVAMLQTVVQQGFLANFNAAPVWPQLPFKPTDQAPSKFDGLPYLKVNQFIVRNPQAVYANMHPANGSVCVQAALSLPVPAVPVNTQEVLQVMTRLGLQGAHSVDNTGFNKFKVTADTTAVPNPNIVNKLLLRVGAHDINVVRQADLPANGQQIQVGYGQGGLEQTTNRTVQ